MTCKLLRLSKDAHRELPMSTILLVEYEPTVKDDLKKALGSSCVVLEATSAVDALDTFRAHREIDLLICEVEMGLVSGMELASLLRAWNPKLRTILTSDLPCDQWTDRQALELSEIPSDEVLILERPFTGLKLKAAIQKLAQEAVHVASVGSM
jgi:CheY-like chemotaxis protein